MIHFAIESSGTILLLLEVGMKTSTLNLEHPLKVQYSHTFITFIVAASMNWMTTIQPSRRMV